MEKLVAFMWVITLTLLLVLLNGWSVMLLWNWFAVPLGVFPIGIAHSVGLTLLALRVHPYHPPTFGIKQEKVPWTDKDYYALFGWLTAPIFSVLVGWLIITFFL